MRLWLYCFAGLLYDWLIYVAWTVIPIRAVRLEASSTQLGLLQMSCTLVYTLGCLVTGRMADRFSKSWMARAGCVGAFLACLAISRADALAALFLTVPLLGLFGSVFWPAVQGAIGSETEAARTEKAIGLFNVMWSIGKGMGFLTAGWMTGRFGPQVALWSAAAAGLAILFFYPGKEGPRAAPEEGGPAEGRAAFRTMGYVANFFAFGVGSTFQIHFFKYLSERNLGTLWDRETFFGAFLGAVFLAQTAAFWAMQRGNRWTYRRWPLYTAQAFLAASTGVLTAAGNDLFILALAPLLGIGLGFCYASSIYYSLHGASHHGKYSGIHEAVLGAGNIILPLAGGMLADGTGDLRAPYWLAAGALLAAIGIEEGIYRTSSRSCSNRSMR